MHLACTEGEEDHICTSLELGRVLRTMYTHLAFTNRSPTARKLLSSKLLSELHAMSLVHSLDDSEVKYANAQPLLQPRQT